jgi:hypothetical protein
MKKVCSMLVLLMAAAGLCWADDTSSDSLTPRQLFYSPRVDQRKPPRAKPPRPKDRQAPQPEPEPERTPPAAERERDSDPVLGLRYVLRQIKDGKSRDVNPDQTFFTGDRIKIGIEANDTAYLYVVQEGSDGTTDVLYPPAGQHAVRPGVMVEIPAGNEDFVFDATPGTEVLLVVLSRTREADFDKLIESLRGRRPRREPGGQVVMAAARPAAVENARETLKSRNLRIEKRPEVVSGTREEAVYVVNTATGDTGRRVVAEILLKHR